MEERLEVRLSRELKEHVSRMAKHRGESSSEYVRHVLEVFSEGPERVQKAQESRRGVKYAARASEVKKELKKRLPKAEKGRAVRYGCLGPIAHEAGTCTCSKL